MKIGWFVGTKTFTTSGELKSKPQLDLLIMEPEKVGVTDEHGSYKYCPAFAIYTNQTFLLRSPFDLELNFYNNEVNVLYSSISPNVLKDHLTIDMEKNPIVQLELHIGFVADETCFIELTSDHFSINRPNNHVRVVPGTYDISSWQRLLNYSIEWTDTSKPISIKRGDPLLYVRFRTKNPSEKFELKRIEMTDDLLKSVARSQLSKFYVSGKTWTLMKLNKLMRRKIKFVK